MNGLPYSYQKPEVVQLPEVPFDEPTAFVPVVLVVTVIIIAVDIAVIIIDGITFSRARSRATNSRMLRGPALKILAPAPG